MTRTYLELKKNYDFDEKWGVVPHFERADGRFDAKKLLKVSER